MLSVKVIAKESIGGNHWIFKLGKFYQIKYNKVREPGNQ